MHRPATVDDPTRSELLLRMLERLSQETVVVLPVHPRTRKKLQEHGLWEQLLQLRNVLAIEPLDYFAFQKLLATAAFVVTDSGGVQEETTWRGVPCLTLRPNTERPVTITQGTNRLVAFDVEALNAAVAEIRSGITQKGGIPELWDGHATERVFDVLRQAL